ncbi:MAG: ATP-binding protein [Bacteroidales bacterium]|nr:ATP-binding protein [Bacteroidales bacterium]
MILEFKIRNFLSFKDETTFSFEATSDSTLEDYYVTEVVPGVRILKMAMVYGANASGKSNLLEAFGFIDHFIGDIPRDKDEETGFVPFKFDDTKDKPGGFELTFYIESLKHKYYLELDSNIIHREKLVFYPGTQPAVIFDRRFNSEDQTSVIEYGSKLKISDQAKEAVQLKTLKNTSVFAAYKQVNLSIKEIDVTLRWFNDQFFEPIDPYISLTEYSDKQIKTNDKIRQLALEFIKKADFNISNILFEEEVKPVPEDMIKFLEVSTSIPEKEKVELLKDRQLRFDNTIFEHKVIRNEKVEYFRLHENFQSKGTMRFYGLSAPFFKTIENNAFLSIDEIGSALHPLLVMHFLREFLNRSTQAQLLFTTHNISLLMEKELLRKDAIWFTEKGADGATSLFSLSDFNIRKELSFYNAYKQGKFGAIPKLED